MNVLIADKNTREILITLEVAAEINIPSKFLDDDIYLRVINPGFSYIRGEYLNLAGNNTYVPTFDTPPTEDASIPSPVGNPKMVAHAGYYFSVDDIEYIRCLVGASPAPSCYFLRNYATYQFITLPDLLSVQTLLGLLQKRVVDNFMTSNGLVCA